MEYYLFVDLHLQATDTVLTGKGLVIVDRVIIDGEEIHGDHLEDDYDGDSGILIRNEQGKQEFISHGEIVEIRW